jgi:hypothetical protein
MSTDSSLLHGCFRCYNNVVKQCLLEDEIEQSLLEELTASDQSSCSDDDDSSRTNNLTIVEVTGSECSDRK